MRVQQRRHVPQLDPAVVTVLAQLVDSLTARRRPAANPLVVVRTEVVGDALVARGLWLWCPGCDLAHRPRAALPDGTHGDGPIWEWNGATDATFTISPSLLVTTNKHGFRCHSFIRDGHWQFLSDCTHQLAGQTVPMVPVPDWLLREGSP